MTFPDVEDERLTDPQALRLDGTRDYATVPDSASLDISSAITMATWVRPEKWTFATQNLIKKATVNFPNDLEMPR